LISHHNIQKLNEINQQFNKTEKISGGLSEKFFQINALRSGRGAAMPSRQRVCQVVENPNQPYGGMEEEQEDLRQKVLAQTGQAGARLLTKALTLEDDDTTLYIPEEVKAPPKKKAKPKKGKKKAVGRPKGRKPRKK